MKNLKKQDYQKAFKGKKFYQQNFLITFLPNNKTHPRLGLAIAKKHYKVAVARNLVKRIIRENFRNSKLPKVDVVFVSKKKAKTNNREIIHQEINILLNKIVKET